MLFRSLSEWNRNRRARWTDEQKAERIEYQRQWFSEHPEYNREKMAESAARNPIRFMVNAAKQRAAKLEVPFDLDWRQIEIPELCPVFGIPLKKAKGKGPRSGSPSLDRLVPALGYVHSNVRVISQDANVIKNSKTSDEMRAYVADLRYRLERAEAVLAYLERELA